MNSSHKKYETKCVAQNASFHKESKVTLTTEAFCAGHVHYDGENVNIARATKAQAVSRPIDNVHIPRENKHNSACSQPKVHSAAAGHTVCGDGPRRHRAVWVSRASTNYETQSMRKDQQRRDQQNEPITGGAETRHSPTPLTTPRPFKMQHRDLEQQGGKIVQTQRSAKNCWPRALGAKGDKNCDNPIQRDKS